MGNSECELYGCFSQHKPVFVRACCEATAIIEGTPPIPFKPETADILLVLWERSGVPRCSRLRIDSSCLLNSHHCISSETANLLAQTSAIWSLLPEQALWGSICTSKTWGKRGNMAFLSISALGPKNPLPYLACAAAELVFLLKHALKADLHPEASIVI